MTIEITREQMIDLLRDAGKRAGNVTSKRGSHLIDILVERGILKIVEERPWPRVYVANHYAWWHTSAENYGIQFSKNDKKATPGLFRPHERSKSYDNPDLDGVSYEQFLSLCESGEMWNPWEYRFHSAMQLVYCWPEFIIRKRDSEFQCHDSQRWVNNIGLEWDKCVPITTAQALCWIEEHKPMPEPKPERAWPRVLIRGTKERIAFWFPSNDGGAICADGKPAAYTTWDASVRCEINTDRLDLDRITEAQFLALCKSGEMWEEPREYRVGSWPMHEALFRKGSQLSDAVQRYDVVYLQWLDVAAPYWSNMAPITASQALVWIEEHAPKPAPDPRDEKISALEREIASLKSEIQGLIGRLDRVRKEASR